MKTSVLALIAVLAALSVNGAITTWTGTTGDWGTGGNWDNGTPTSADDAYVSNGGTATIAPGDAYVGSRLYLGQASSSSGNLSMTGGSLTLGGAPSLVVANGTGSAASLTMAGPSSITNSGNVQIGARGVGTMDVGSDASVSSAILFIGSAASGVGTLNLAGSWSATKVVVVNNAAAQGVLNLDGGSLSVSGDFDMDFAGLGAELAVNGSSGSFYAGGNFLAASSSATLEFVADAAGFTPLQIGGSISVAGATLNIDLDAYVGPTNAPLVLMSGSSVSAGEFGAINWLGSDTAFVAYGTTNITLTWTEPGETPRLPATMTWVGATGSFAHSNNWDLAYVPVAGDELRISNGGTATITAGDGYSGGKLLLGRGASGVGNLSMSGGSLTLDLLPSLSVADGSGSSSTVDMTGTSTIVASGNILVGARGTGLMNVGADGDVSSAALFLSSAAGGAGTLNLAGSWNASGWVNMGHPTLAVGNSVLNLNGGSLASSGYGVNANGSHALNVNGSAGAFSVGGDFTATNGNFTLGFVADAGGITTLNVSSNIAIQGATLDIDLSAYSAPWSSLVLLDGASVDGTFGAVNISGGSGLVVYDTDNGDVLLVSSLDIASIGIGAAGGSTVVSVAFGSEAEGSLWFTPDLVFPSWTTVASGTSPLSHTNAAPAGFYKVTIP